MNPARCFFVLASTVISLAAQDAPKPQNPPPATPPATTTREIEWNNTEGSKAPGLEHRSLLCQSMQQEIGFNVWTPPGYGNSNERFPVIYFLHGAGGNENSDAGGFSGLLRTAIERQKMPPVICVCPNGGMSGYRDQLENKVMIETFIMTELIPYVDANWRTIGTREGRALAGFSMGGGGAMRLAVKYPDRFSAAASWAAALTPRRSGATNDVLAEVVKNRDQIKDRVRLLLIVGDKDQTFAGHAPFIAQLKESNIAHEFVVLPEVSHNLGKYYSDTGARLVEFLGSGFRGLKAR